MSILRAYIHPKFHAYHVRCDEQPLRQLAFSQVLVEHGSILVGHGNVLLVGQTLGRSVCVEDDRRVVLPHVVVGLGLLVDVALALEAGVRHVLLVSRPGNALVLEQVDKRGNVGIDSLEVVVVTAEGVTANGSNVVGHGRVGHAEHVGDADALGCQPLKVGVSKGIGIVGVLEPDRHIAIEDLL